MAPIQLLIGLAIVCLLAPPAEAQTAATNCKFTPISGQPIFAGVQLQDVTVACPTGLTSTAHVVTIDLTTQGVALVALSAAGPKTIVPPVARTFLVSERLKQTQTQVAINANLFTACCDYDGDGRDTALLGLAYSHGLKWSPVANLPQKPKPPPGDYLSSLIVVNGQASIVTLKPGQSPPRGVTVAVTGSHRILTGGTNTAPTDTTPSWFSPTARTAVGYNVGGHDGSQVVAPRLWLVAVDYGGPTSSAGVTLPQAADLLLFLGASDGINLDGGGSTTMVRAMADGPPKFINTPKDWPPKGQTCRVAASTTSCERYVGFGLAVAAPLLP